MYRPVAIGSECVMISDRLMSLSPVGCIIGNRDTSLNVHFFSKNNSCLFECIISIEQQVVPLTIYRPLISIEVLKLFHIEI